ncbi:UNVERIFIED_CONTAM: hypothetical protein N8J90_14680 [Halobacillus marinus]
MKERMKNGMISAITFAVFAVLFGYYVGGEIRWENVTGLAIGGFISWAFIIPRIRKLRGRKEE